MIPAPSDPPKASKEYQAELGAFTQSMRAEGIEGSSRDYLVEDASGFGFALAEFLVIAKTLSPCLLLPSALGCMPSTVAR
jgi:hypothetical protein